MGDFSRCIDPILAEEGGLSRHPDDPGGLTKYGISQRSYPKLNIAALTLANAEELYRNDYWLPIHGDQLPDGLDLLMLDCAINQGPQTAIKLLQHALQIQADGLIGPQTLSAAEAAMPGILDTFAAERALRYELNPNEATFGRGWFRRLLRMHRQAWAMIKTASMVQP
jgi:lysozyme family protein